MTFFHKNELKSPTNFSCALNPLKSKMGFRGPFLLESSKINPSDFSGIVISPFTGKKGFQNRDVSTDCTCIQLGISRMHLSAPMGRKKYDLKKWQHRIITKLYYMLWFKSWISFKSWTKNILPTSDESQQISGNYYLLQYCYKSFPFLSFSILMSKI